MEHQNGEELHKGEGVSWLEELPLPTTHFLSSNHLRLHSKTSEKEENIRRLSVPRARAASDPTVYYYYYYSLSQ